MGRRGAQVRVCKGAVAPGCARPLRPPNATGPGGTPRSSPKVNEALLDWSSSLLLLLLLLLLLRLLQRRLLLPQLLLPLTVAPHLCRPAR